MLADGQTQAADQLPVLDAVHVQRVPVVLLAGRGARPTVTLVLTRQHTTDTLTQGGTARGPERDD